MKQTALLFLIYFLINTVNATPYASWYLDELGTASYPYTLNDSQGSNDGIAYITPSTGNSSGKICSALDFSANSTADYALLGADALNGASNFTISFWHKGSSTSGRSLLSGARSAQRNELLMWFTNGNRFNGYINGSASSGINFPSITDNQWHHISWRRSGTQSCLFTDGIQRGCNTVQSKILSIESLILGQEQDSVGGGFDIAQDWEGLVDELLIFRSALGNADIQSIYNNQNSGNTWDNNPRTCLTTPPLPPSVDYGYSDWHFDEDSWNGIAGEVIDSHGGQHGTAYSVTAVAGKICNAMDLTASSTQDYAKLGAASLDGVGDFTISIWHKGTSNNSKAVLSGATSGSDNELLFWFTNPTTFNGYLKGASLGSVTGSSFTDGNWHHLVWTRTGTLSCYYLDTQLQGCQANTISSPVSITSLILGQDQDSVGGGFASSQDWEGVLDELLVFRRSLDNTAITSIYNNQNTGKNWDGSYRACPNMPAMKLTKTSSVISDPINLTHNPKRIPGSIIHYTITAENAHATAADGVVITDDLNDEISGGRLAWVGNIKVTSPNINAGIVTALTDTAGDDEGEFISNIISVDCGSITSSNPCITEYDVEIIQ